jgi:hypothetical protein
VIADFAPMLRWRLVRRDVETLVYLPRVGDDDLSAELERKTKRDLRLSDAGRADDDGNYGDCRIPRA